MYTNKCFRLFFGIMFVMVLTFSASFLLFLLEFNWISIAVTICNVNQAQRSAVSRIPRESEEYSVLQSICRYTVDENVTNSVAGTWNIFRKVLLDVSNLVMSKSNLSAHFSSSIHLNILICIRWVSPVTKCSWGVALVDSIWIARTFSVAS